MIVIKYCKDLIVTQQWVITISHCYRKANKVADWLANKGVNQIAKLEIHTSP